MRSFLNKLSALPYVILGGFLLSTKAEAAISVYDPSSGLGYDSSSDLIQATVNVVSWVLGLLALIAVVMIVIAGFQWMTAGGNEDQVGNAKKRIYAAGIGLVIVLLAWAIVLLAINTIADASNTSIDL